MLDRDNLLLQISLQSEIERATSLVLNYNETIE